MAGFNPSANKYTDTMMSLLSQMAMKEYAYEQKQKRATSMIEKLKKSGLVGGDSGAYMSGIDLETGSPEYGFMSPLDKMKFKQAKEFEGEVGGGVMDAPGRVEPLAGEQPPAGVVPGIGIAGRPVAKPSPFRLKGYSKSSPLGTRTYERVTLDEDINQAVKKQIALQDVKGLSIETGGKLAMVKQAKKDIGEARKMLFPDGTADSFVRGLAYASNIPGGRAPVVGAILPQAMPFHEKGQKIYSRLQNAVAAKLRVETGAQANPAEVENILKRFGISAFSDPKAAFDALERLEDFMDETINITDPTGRFTRDKGSLKSKSKKVTPSFTTTQVNQMRAKGAVGYDDVKGVFVDAQGREVK